MNFKLFILVIISGVLFSAEPPNAANPALPWSSGTPSFNNLNKLGEWGFPSNPMNDRAVGYLFKGKVKSGVTNYGEFIEWDVHPAGLWGDYSYLPAVAFVSGVPGQSYSYRFDWYTNESNPACPASSVNGVTLWCSDNAYEDPNELNPYFSWHEYGDTNYVGVVFEHYNDQGLVGEQKNYTFEINS